MGTVIEANDARPFRFPLSPPSSGTVTAISSPRLTPSQHSSDPEIVDKLLGSASTFHRAHSSISSFSWRPRSPGKDPGHFTADSIPLSKSKRSLPATARPLSDHAPPQSSSPSSSPSSSWSSSAQPEHASPLHSNSGIGRKVAASLRLFKESANVTPDDVLPCESSRSEVPPSAARRPGPRSERLGREAAAERRGRSITVYENPQTLDVLSVPEAKSSQKKEKKLSNRDDDNTHGQKEMSARPSDGRGRRRERTSYENLAIRPDLSMTPIPAPAPHICDHSRTSLIRPRSRGYPPSPSRSHSPTSRRTPSQCSSDMLSRVMDASHGGQFDTPRTVSWSHPQPLAIPPSARHVVLDTPSSTDDESAWETASAMTSASTVSAKARLLSQIPNTPPHSPTNDSDPVSQSSLLVSASDVECLDDTGDLVKSWSQVRLPPVPLKPFRNQVGGHSSIYKFTKRAVCKPLVSRENLFYESVEREAPPLLGYIPRYLGVMFVSYRRVPRTRTPPLTPSPERVARMPLMMANKRRASAPKVASKTTAIVNPAPGKRSEGMHRGNRSDAEDDEAEMPEVALDRNPHIIPKWMLGGGRNRSFSHSNATGAASFYRRSLRQNPTHLTDGTASSPDLGQPLSNVHPLSQPSSLVREPSSHAPPLASSASLDHIHQSSAKPSPSSAYYQSASGFSRFTPSERDDLLSRPILRPFHSDRIRSPAWFKGRGSTTVNTKLKDHVFSSVLRRFRRQGRGRWSAGSGSEDEGIEADGEGDGLSTESDKSTGGGSTGPGQGGRRRKGGPSNAAKSIRRVQSESTLAKSEQLENLSSQLPIGCEAGVDWQSAAIPSPLRRRSRSRSLDAPTLPLHLPSSHSVAEKATSLAQKEEPSVTRQNHFILMENLTGGLKRSCVMDLKMGTRQYGMDATPAKKKSQRKKCDRTTSRSLGVRVCGMQVWNHMTQAYISQDKYKGREILPAEFSSVLASFLHDGERLLGYHIPLLLQKLYGLARIVNRLKGYRFYGCSLLLIYDGDREAQEAFRLSVLEHPSSRSKRGESLDRHTFRRKSESKQGHPTLRRSHSEDLLIGPVAKRSGHRRRRGEIDIRIVDFAHTTTGRDWKPYPTSVDGSLVHDANRNVTGYQADTDPDTGLIYARFPPHYPDQPDRGFLFGLRSIANTLEQIWNEERIRRTQASRDDPSFTSRLLFPLPTDGKEIFEEIFGPQGSLEDPGMIST